MRVVSETRNHKLYIDEGAEGVTATLKIYPHAGFGNNYAKEISISTDGSIEVIFRCDGWAVGPCRSMTDSVTIAEFRDISLAAKLIEMIRSINSIDDFTRVAKTIEIEQNKIDETVEELFNNVVDILVDLANEYSKKEQLGKLLADKEELKEILRQALEDYLS